jgi:hypothetical protein
MVEQRPIAANLIGPLAHYNDQVLHVAALKGDW